MAVFEFIQVAPASNGSNNTIYAATLGAAGNSTVITTGKDMIIRVVGSGALTIRFGTADNLASSPATATDIYLPANLPYVVDMGHQNSAISLYSVAANTIVTVNQIVKN
jgi:hypothetical protein